ncbi:ATP-binding protein [Streptosporangium sp. G11]|uniref:ATP-binding protein n=1 Tax=Streptosporangium sp. G11 TaxID=3436926 RepID=UPI003EBB6B87
MRRRHEDQQLHLRESRGVPNHHLPISIPPARAFVRAALRLRELAGDEGDEYMVLLVVGELVTSSVRHSNSGRRQGGPVMVKLRTKGPVLRLAVVDEGASDSAPQVRRVGAVSTDAMTRDQAVTRAER